jgi:hypothetical protein
MAVAAALLSSTSRSKRITRRWAAAVAACTACDHKKEPATRSDAAPRDDTHIPHPYK